MVRNRSARPTPRRTLGLLVALLLTVSLVTLPAPARAGEGATTAKPTTYIDEGFDTARWDTQSPADWWNWPNTISRGTVQGLLGDATRVTMRAGTNIGAMLDWEFARQGYTEPDEAWFRYWMRFDDPPENTGKLPGFMGLYSNSARGKVPPSDSRPGWSARVMFGPGDDETAVKLGYYTYHLDQSGSTGDSLWWSEQAPLDQWVCIEGRVAMNTPGVADGELQAWLNDEEVFNRGDLEFRTASQPDVRIKQFMFEVYYGGAEARYDTGVAFDELRVADQRIGCATGMPSFLDTGQSPYVDDIEWLVANGITVGCNPPDNTRFCPTSALTRSHLAGFLYRALGDVIEVPEPPPGPPDPQAMWGFDTIDYTAAMAATGASVDFVHVEHRLNKGDWTEQRDWEDPFHRPLSRAVPAQLSTIHLAGSVPYVEFHQPGVAKFNSGSYDANFDGWVDVITGWLAADASRRILIAPFAAANNEDVGYRTSAATFRDAYRKVHDAIRSRAIGPDQARFVYQMSAELNSSYYLPDAAGSGFGAYSPGDVYIDLAAISWINDARVTWDDWDSLYADRVSEMTAELGAHVPVLLASVASAPFNGLGDRRDYWFDDLADGINSTSNVVGFLYMDRDRDGIAYGVDLATDPDPAFVEFVGDVVSPGLHADWIFDGSMDTWKEETIAVLPSSVFLDDDGSAFESEVAWLARSGIAHGCNPPTNDRFCPDDKVTRGQTAAFLHRALGDLLPVGNATSFGDIASSQYAADIAWLESVGIAQSCNPPANTRFCPNGDMTRAEMALLLRLALSSL